MNTPPEHERHGSFADGQETEAGGDDEENEE